MRVGGRRRMHGCGGAGGGLVAGANVVEEALVLVGNPVAVEVRRGGRVESRHRAAFAVRDAEGAVVMQGGEAQAPVFPRSAIKPLQALPLLETGAADAFGVSDAEIALACGSHGGEPGHVATAAAWLARLGLDETALACGPHLPSHAATADALRRRGEAPSRLHNNCSGKHCGMLATARHRREPIKGYAASDHPVQGRIRAVLEAMSDAALPDDPGVDGCGVPTWPLPLDALGLAAARLAAPDLHARERRLAIERVHRAMRARPDQVAGSGRLCTVLMRTAPHLLVKTGAEGVFIAAWPERRLGLALKVEDGAMRAAEVALLALLHPIGALDAAAIAALEGFARPSLRNHEGDIVGDIRPAPGWLEAATS